jgi:ATP-binding cassette subfamily F protein 3
VLGAFLFSGDDVDKKVRVLSGGERARVALARMLIRPGNFLLMDEPTNHLDLASAESLAESLGEYDGTLLFVSHNRSFVKRLATQIWNLEAGKLEVYPGSLDEYMYAQRARQEAAERAAASSRQAERAASSGASAARAEATKPGVERAARGDDKERKRREAEQRAQRNKLVKPLKDKLAQLESRIEKLEQQQKQVTEQLSDGAVYADAQRRSSLLGEFEANKQELDKLTSQWETLTQELEAKESELT